MQYLKVNDDTWVEFEPVSKRTRVLKKSELTDERMAAAVRLSEIPALPTDEELLEWARANFPAMNYSREVENLTLRIAEIDNLLPNLA